jgi:putative DNA primase/helicase
MDKDEPDNSQPNTQNKEPVGTKCVGTLEDADLSLFLEDIDAELSGSSAVADTPIFQNTAEVFAAVEDQVPEVDFVAEIGSAKPNQMQIVVTVVRILLEVMQALGVGLCRIAGELRCFTGSFWELLSIEELEPFLGKVAMLMSVNPILAQHYGFRKSLVKQFYSVATIPTRERPNDKVLINYRNGTLEIRAEGRVSRKFDKNDYLTYALAFDYDPEAVPALWNTFLWEVLPDPESRAVLAEAIAYAFSPLKLEKVAMLFGSGANGKSVVLDVIQALFGSENITNFSLKNLDHPYYRAKIANKLLNISSEATTSIAPDEFKKLASGEPIDARNVYEQPFIVRSYARLMFSSNELPSEIEHTDAYFRRFLIIPFHVTIPKEKQDPNLAKTIIKTELPGILNWVLHGLDRLNMNKAFSTCPASEKELERYRLETNSVALFCDDRGYTPSTDEKQRIKLADIYDEYREFCRTNNLRAVSTRKFHKRLTNLGYGSKKLNLGIVIFAERQRSAEKDNGRLF